MNNLPEVKELLGLISSGKVDLSTSLYSYIDDSVKDVLLIWLKEKNFPADNPVDLVGDSCCVAWFKDNFKLFIFGFSYADAEQCGGTIVISTEQDKAKFELDTVECSS